MERWGLLLINLGTPDAPEPGPVRRYLREFLSDPRVIDMAAWKRSLLLNAVILPFRPRRSAAAYRKVWGERGSPLLVHGMDLEAKLQAALGERARVELAMRYGSPSIAAALASLQGEGVDRLAVLPLFPQYASSSWGSAVEAVYREAGRAACVPPLHVVPPFYDHPAFIRACAAVARPVLSDLRPDRVLLSFHGLPERHLRQSDLSGQDRCLEGPACCAAIDAGNRFCYRAQCFATARALAAALELAPDAYEVSFQSRLGRTPWIQPYTDHRLRALPGEGVRRLAVLSPSFVADCLETLEEIGLRGRDDFLASGGEELRLVPCLNSEQVWVEAVLELLREVAPGLGAPTP